jgi:hypothetical protein
MGGWVDLKLSTGEYKNLKLTRVEYYLKLTRVEYTLKKKLALFYIAGKLFSCFYFFLISLYGNFFINALIHTTHMSRVYACTGACNAARARAILQNRKLAFLAGKKVSFSFFYAAKQVSFYF